MRAAALLCQLHLNRLSFPAKIKRHVVDEGSGLPMPLETL